MATKPAAKPATKKAVKATPLSRGDLIDIVSANHGLTKAAAKDLVVDLFNVIRTKAMSGVKVSIADFGIFSRKERPARTARNPATGDTIKVPAKSVFSFKASKIA